MSMRHGFLAALITTAALLFTSLATASQPRFITIGTAGVTGVYYPVGGAICRLVNQGRAEHGMRCSAESTGGSVFNLNSLRGGDFDIVLAQSDWHYHAWHGSDRFADNGADEKLRALFSLQIEAFTVLARPDAKIEKFTDLKGKRVNIGNPGSGQRGTAETLLAALGMSTDDFSLTTELPSREQAQVLCDNRVDAIFFTVGHPTGSIQEPISTCNARLVPVVGDKVDALVADRPYYAATTIPGGMYPGNPDDIRTFGVAATLVASADTSDEAVYQVVRAVFENFDAFRRLHPALGQLSPEAMIRDGLSAPLHEGAKRYYREAGLLQD